MPTVIQRPGEERSPLVESALAVAIVAAKTATVAFAVDAFVNADLPRLQGKAIRTRAVGYAGALLVVPVLWWLLPDRGRYPRALDLAVTIPLLLDAGGNALDLYEEARIDDVVHVAELGDRERRGRRAVRAAGRRTLAGGTHRWRCLGRRRNCAGS